MSLSKALSRINPSATLVITQKVRTLRETGVNVIGLGAGEPDFDTPNYIKEAAIRAIWDGQTKYTNVDGMPALKEAICRKFKRDNDLTYKPEQINVSPGGKPVIYNALIASLNPADEVIIPTPCWVSYPDMVKLAGGEPVLVKTSLADQYKLTAETLEKGITPKTKWLILNSPSNPTGIAYTKHDLRALADVLRKHPHVWVLTDDMYEHLMYDGFDFFTLGQVAPDLMDRILTMNGVSKAYAMTGWRIGYAGGPKSLISAMAKVMGQTTSNAASISQCAAIAALDGSQEFIKQSNIVYKARRDMLLEQLNQIPGLACLKPQGAFYVYPECSQLMGKISAGGRKLNTDVDFAEALLEENHVAVVPGAAFHSSPSFRISYSVSTRELEIACKRIKKFCSDLVPDPLANEVNHDRQTQQSAAQ